MEVHCSAAKIKYFEVCENIVMYKQMIDRGFPIEILEGVGWITVR